MASSSSSEPLCPNWIFSNTSNVHACKNRGWFKDYIPFASTLGSIYGDISMPVLGIGTVVLPVKVHPNRTGLKAHGQLVLHHVLHAPSLKCNIVAFTKDIPKFNLGGLGNSMRGNIEDKDGKQIAYFNPKKVVFQVKLSGPPIGPVTGPSVLKEDGMYLINVHWSDEEKAKWEEYNLAKEMSSMTVTAAKQTSKTSQGKAKAEAKASTKKSTLDRPYTNGEKAWLQKYTGGEFKFLQNLGLSIYKDEDREEGRAITRALMKEDKTGGKAVLGGMRVRGAAGAQATRLKKGDFGDDDFGDLYADDDDDEEEGEENEDEDAGLTGHMTDYLFDHETLDFLEKHYGSSLAFMETFCLKFYDKDDCEEAKSIAKAMMEADSQ